MDCQEFLEGYSSYLDGVASTSEQEAFDDHLECCEACARYDRVVQRGLKVFRNLPRVRTSSDFLPRLRHRLYHVDDAIPERSRTSGGSAALVAVAAVGILALAWMPFATSVPVEVELPAVSVEAPPPESAESLPSLFDRGPFLAPTPGSSHPGLLSERAANGASWTYPPSDMFSTGALLLVGAGSGTPAGR